MRRVFSLALTNGLRATASLLSESRAVSVSATSAPEVALTAPQLQGKQPAIDAPTEEKKLAAVALAEYLLTSVQEPEQKDATVFVNKFVAYMLQDMRRSEKRRGSGTKHASRAATQRSLPALLTATQRQRITGRISQIVEARSVSLVVATRLVKRPWSPSMDTDNCRDTQNFIKGSLKAWIIDEINRGVLSPSDARAVLANSAHLLRREDVSIVGSLAEVASQDLDNVFHPDALISLMWSVHTTGAHAPQSFWTALLDRLLFLNGNLRGKMAGVMEVEEKKSLSSSPETQHSERRQRDRQEQVGHVFSGLTTRQIYRLLAVLKREKWNGNTGPLRDLADQALKNIVFETEAASFLTTPTDVSGVSPLSKHAVEHRVKVVSDLSMEEFLTLLGISGDFGIPFSVSAARVSDHILTPMVRYLDSVQLLQVMLIVRQTRCNSPALMNAVAAKIGRRGPHAPYSLPLTKAFARTILKETDLFPQVNLTSFLFFFFRVCDEQASKVRGEELCSLSDVLYGLSRRFAPTSTVGRKLRHTVDLFCRQMDRLLQLEIVQAGFASRLLEYTIVLGMRSDTDLHRNVTSLLGTRNVAVERERARMNRVSERVAARAAGETGKQSPRWEDQSECELPQVPKAALTVYGELIYMFERMAVVKASLTWHDFSRFDEAFDRTGLYNIFLGAHLMKVAHLDELGGTDTGSTHSFNEPFKDVGGETVMSTQLNALPGWMEKRVHDVVVRKIRHARLSDTSTDDEVLHVLGHLHCDTQKVHHFIDLVMTSPFRVLQNQRELWGYTKELARRFGSKEDQQVAAGRFATALF